MTRRLLPVERHCDPSRHGTRPSASKSDPSPRWSWATRPCSAWRSKIRAPRSRTRSHIGKNSPSWHPARCGAASRQGPNLPAPAYPDRLDMRRCRAGSRVAESRRRPARPPRSSQAGSASSCASSGPEHRAKAGRARPFRASKPTWSMASNGSPTPTLRGSSSRARACARAALPNSASMMVSNEHPARPGRWQRTSGPGSAWRRAASPARRRRRSGHAMRVG